MTYVVLFYIHQKGGVLFVDVQLKMEKEMNKSFLELKKLTSDMKKRG